VSVFIPIKDKRQSYLFHPQEILAFFEKSVSKKAPSPGVAICILKTN
jgi:hypothetical protein